MVMVMVMCVSLLSLVRMPKGLVAKARTLLVCLLRTAAVLILGDLRRMHLYTLILATWQHVVNCWFLQQLV
jgi:hypothetical protein